ncbi:MAG: helix-turn-helix transcriptional regulator [Clostridia bacterium]|nr:helix-turn-helix transcriptional regulator [Clostridia bacterium]
MDYNAIGQRIKRMRKARGLSQENLAEFAEISTVHMSHIETGKTKLSLPVIVAIADALDVRVDSLLYDEPRSGVSIAVDEIAALLEGCDAKQTAFIADLVRAAKHALDNYTK